MGLLQDTADWVKSKQCRISRWYSDGSGEYAFKTTIHGNTFYVCARSYTHNGVTSFMNRLLSRASDEDGALILLRVGSPEIEQMLVFDPTAVQEHGEENVSRDDRKNRGERWTDIPVGWGCTLSDFMSDYDSPQTEPDGSAGGTQTRLDRQ